MQSSINLQVFASFQKCCVVSLHHIYMLQEPKRFREYSIWCAGEHFNTICLYDKKEKKIKKGPSAELRGERTRVSSSNHRMSIFSSLIMVKHHLVSTWVHWKWFDTVWLSSVLARQSSPLELSVTLTPLSLLSKSHIVTRRRVSLIESPRGGGVNVICSRAFPHPKHLLLGALAPELLFHQTVHRGGLAAYVGGAGGLGRRGVHKGICCDYMNQ